MIDKTGTTDQTFWTRGGKRVFDVLMGSVLAVVLLPALILASLLVKLTSRGPIFFSQIRGGLNGQPFRLIKFRTMRGDRTPDAKELVPLDHPEITLVGRWFRRFKVDELPQLLHVITGDMSLVGPRPTLLDQVQAYDEFRKQRLFVRPGVTGLAQVYAHARSSWDERILYDIAYVRRCCFLLDAWILIRSLYVVTRGEERTARPFSSSRFAKYVNPPEGYATPARDA